MITIPLRYGAPDTDYLFLFFEIEKKQQQQRYAPNHDASSHVFKQLSQIVRFK